MEDLIKKLSTRNITIHISCLPAIDCFKVVLTSPEYYRELLISMTAATASVIGISEYIRMEIERVLDEFLPSEAFNV